jgi:hypothetical protein
MEGLRDLASTWLRRGMTYTAIANSLLVKISPGAPYEDDAIVVSVNSDA